MGGNRLNQNAYRSFSSTIDSSNTTRKAKEEHTKTGKLDPLVDPAEYGVIRRSLNRMDQKGDHWILTVAPAMLLENRLDTTGSMGNNVDRAFTSLPRMYGLISKLLTPKYDLQIINSVFEDAVNDYILCRSQAEMDIKVAEQLTLMFPRGGGGANHGEESQYGLFAGAYLTAADINRYGLKSYDFTVTDEPAHNFITEGHLIRVFGEKVFERLEENGHKMDPKNLPSVKQVVDDLLKRAHAFIFIIDDTDEAAKYWPTVISKERIIHLNSTDFLPEVQAAIIGLTEGVLTLNTVEDFLVKKAKLSKEDAKMIVRAVAGIPIGAQTEFENFDKLPVKGSFFKDKRDLWPTTEYVEVDAGNDEEKEEDDDMNWNF